MPGLSPVAPPAMLSVKEAVVAELAESRLDV